MTTWFAAVHPGLWLPPNSQGILLGRPEGGGGGSACKHLTSHHTTRMLCAVDMLKCNTLFFQLIQLPFSIYSGSCFAPFDMTCIKAVAARQHPGLGTFTSMPATFGGSA